MALESDCLLRIEIWDGVPKPNLECDDFMNTVVQWVKEDAEKENAAVDAHTNSEKQYYIWKKPKRSTNVFVGYDDEEQEEIMETSDEESFESSSSEDSEQSDINKDIDESNSDEEMDESNSKGSAIVCVKSIHINSLILAEKSLFFSKLFSNEPRESEHRNVTIRIHVSEEAALMHLLSFICTNTLSTPISLYGLVEVIRVADKYKVSSCMKYCSKLLLYIKMTPVVAIVFLKFPFIVRMVEGVQPVVDAAKQYLTRYFNTFEKIKELMVLPLHGIEVVLSSNDLQIPNEDIVYEFITKWAAFHYSKPDKRRRIMNKRLSKLMRFHYMSSETLRDVLASPNFDSSVSSKFVLNAVFFQSESSRNQHALITAGEFSVKRAYIQLIPLRMVELHDLPIPHCIVYVDLKMEECIRLSTTRGGFFQIFDLNKETFYLNMVHEFDPQSGYHCFGLILGTHNMCRGSTPIKAYLKFSAMQKPSEEFISRYQGNFIFDGGTAVGNTNLFAMPWKDLMAEDCVYFIDGSLHLMVELMIIK